MVASGKACSGRTCRRPILSSMPERHVLYCGLLMAPLISVHRPETRSCGVLSSAPEEISTEAPAGHAFCRGDPYASADTSTAVPL